MAWGKTLSAGCAFDQRAADLEVGYADEPVTVPAAIPVPPEPTLESSPPQAARPAMIRAAQTRLNMFVVMLRPRILMLRPAPWQRQ